MENTSDVILSILTALGTMGSAVAAFLAVKQTIKQRKIAVTPQLVINDYQVRSREIYDDSFNLFPGSAEYFSEHKPEIINAGSGVALNVSVTIEFDFLSRMTFFSSNQYKLNEKYSFEFEDHSSIKDHKVQILITGSQTNILKEADTVINLGYITPYKNNSTTTKLKLSPFYFDVLLNEILFTYKLNNGLAKPIDGPLFKLKYNDIDGNKYEINYKSRLVVHNATQKLNRVSFRCLLEFETSHSSWTERRLQRIRKSYADFMNEHDFNKNK
ncbi:MULTISPECIES: hypothetical protein [Citrobacter]|uniref:hypothetical protein n=1 Tax=Citrobacter TaxID=544 RepID=UPI0011F1F7E7|nr:MULTISPECIES: hypothetical protein [Citrobacter]BDA95977.1 hypothetical protein E5AUHO_35660 [Citrobacter freundii]KAA1148834.1 hypothetical protein D3H39_04565 [Citrobacter portucalensis]MDM2854052.1 hypothetical protein [Citrobacter sp. Cpo065]MDQ9158421.1 hypothetical protein [Citrobacter portucalensis]MDT7469058.1 hypothetical protein [Citrobacter portucalensis]